MKFAGTWTKVFGKRGERFFHFRALHQSVFPTGFVQELPICGNRPVVTEDPTGKSGIPFLLKCGDHASASGDSMEEVLDLWQGDWDDVANNKFDPEK